MTTPAVPSPVQTLLELFATSLAEVRFADLDGPALARLAADVEVAAGEVALAQAALDVAREAMQMRQDVLVQQAQRALAYARVFAENDESLSARLDAISLPRAVRRPRSEDALVLSAEPQPAPRPRGRPRKVRPLEEQTPTLQDSTPSSISGMPPSLPSADVNGMAAGMASLPVA